MPGRSGRPAHPRPARARRTLYLAALRRAGGLRPAGLVLWGAEDDLFPLTQAEAICAALQQARLVTIPRCGHSPSG